MDEMPWGTVRDSMCLTAMLSVEQRFYPDRGRGCRAPSCLLLQLEASSLSRALELVFAHFMDEDHLFGR